MNHNELSGYVSEEWGAIKSLRELGLGGNKFTGDVRLCGCAFVDAVFSLRVALLNWNEDTFGVSCVLLVKTKTSKEACFDSRRRGPTLTVIVFFILLWQSSAKTIYVLHGSHFFGLVTP